MSDWKLIDTKDCPREHPEVAGPCMDVGVCPDCWMPIGVMRPQGETFGFHAEDCSLPERHYGYCVGGGTGHPVGKVRG